MRSPESQKFPILIDIARVMVPKSRRIERIYIHCSDSETGDAELIDEWHRNRKPDPFEEIGYHFVVSAMEGSGTGFDEGIIQHQRLVQVLPSAWIDSERHVITEGQRHIRRIFVITAISFSAF